LWLSLREPSALEGRQNGIRFVPALRSSQYFCSNRFVLQSYAVPFGDLKVIAASESFCRSFQINSATVPGRLLSELGTGEWAMPNLISPLDATASGNAEVESYDLIRRGQNVRCLLVNANKLDDGDEERIRLLLAVTDVTVAARACRDTHGRHRRPATTTLGTVSWTPSRWFMSVCLLLLAALA
jgi:hypothetical protein